MREEITQILLSYEINALGNKKALEIADEKIPKKEKIIYIAPSSVTLTPRNTSSAKLRAGVIAITEENIYVVHKALWETGFDVFPVSDLELVGYKATGITGATIELTLSNVSIVFLVSYKKDLAERLNSELNNLITDRATDPSSDISDAISAIEKLAALKEKGIITQEEFDAKKNQLLNI